MSMEQYPDSDSVNLVVALAEATGRPAGEILEEIGKFWIQFALNSDYGDLIRVAGGSVAEILANLDQLHVRVAQAFPELDPPAFWVTDVDEDSLVLHYSSPRAGLSSLAAGMVQGVAEFLGTEVSISLLESKDDGADHDTFRVVTKQSVQA